MLSSFPITPNGLSTNKSVYCDRRENFSSECPRDAAPISDDDNDEFSGLPGSVHKAEAPNTERNAIGKQATKSNVVPSWV